MNYAFFVSFFNIKLSIKAIIHTVASKDIDINKWMKNLPYNFDRDILIVYKCLDRETTKAKRGK